MVYKELADYEVLYLHKEKPIGIFDSGVGGLTVVKSLLQLMPFEHFIYYGDNANIPYGNKSKEELLFLAQRILAYFLDQEVKAVIVACGSQSSNSLEILEQECPVPVIGILKPGIEQAIKITRNKKIGVMATPATVNSYAFTKGILSLCPDCQVFEQACPDFVPLVEAGRIQGDAVKAKVKEYTAPLMAQEIDVLLLGCTHYPFIESIIREEIGPEINIIDPAIATVALTKDILYSLGALRDGSEKNPGRKYLVSGNYEEFLKVSQGLLGAKNVPNVYQLVL